MNRISMLWVALLAGSAGLYGCGSPSTTGTGASGGTGGTGGTGGSGAVGGTGGTGGSQTTCTDAATQCPDPGSECIVATCVKGACDTKNAGNGTVTTEGQIAGDCKLQVCDGNGSTKVIDKSDDPEDDGNDCTIDACDAGTNVHTPTGGACSTNGGTVCADPEGPKAGQCVECNSDQDCSGTQVCDPVGGTNTCVDPSCVDGVFNGTETDVDCGGACPPCANTMDCGAGADCQSGFCNVDVCAACSNDANCAANEFCDLAVNGGTCADDKGNGTTCSVAGQCASGACVDGFCCDTACAGECQACSASKKGQGLDGVCGSIVVNTDPDNECAPDQPGTCGKTGMCGGNGACALEGATTVCGMQSCSAGMLQTMDFCNGAGMCVDSGSVSCGGYNCDAGGIACLSTCQSDANCAAGNYCSGTMCVAKTPNGGLCAAGSSCASGNCVDGVCCNTGCGGLCQSCNAAGTVGTCTNIALGQDPANECAGTYSCNGNGTCQACGDGVVQAGEACDDGNQIPGDGCENNCTASAPNPLVVCVNPNLAITGAGPGAGNPSVLTIPSSGVITDINVSITCAHTWPGDLIFTLSHGAVSRTIIDRPGVPASTYGCETDDISVTLDDEGSGAVEGVCSLTAPGIFSPPNRIPNNPLNGFDGTNMQGNWNLVVSDAFASGDDGVLNQWCVSITYQ